MQKTSPPFRRFGAQVRDSLDCVRLAAALRLSKAFLMNDGFGVDAAKSGGKPRAVHHAAAPYYLPKRLLIRRSLSSF